VRGALHRVQKTQLGGLIWGEHYIDSIGICVGRQFFLNIILG